MALILDPTTSLVSKMFQMTFDPRLRTVKQDRFDIQWQANAVFLINYKEIKRTRYPFSESIYKKPSLAPEKEGA